MKKLYITLTLTLSLVIILFSFLTFAPPQTHKYVYMWQAYDYFTEGEKPVKLFPAESNWVTPRLYDPTPSYTGIWRIWSREGYLVSVAEAVDGQREGCEIRYRQQSDKVYAEEYVYESKDVEIIKLYNEDGSLCRMAKYYGYQCPNETIYDSETQIDNGQNYQSLIEEFDQKMTAFKKRIKTE